MKLRPAFLSIFLLVTSVPMKLYACTVCFGDPDSSESKALLWGVLFLLVVVGGVLSGILFAGLKIRSREKKLSSSDLQ